LSQGKKTADARSGTAGVDVPFKASEFAGRGSRALSESERDDIRARVGRLPLYFIGNQGQADQRVAFYIQSLQGATYFTATGVTFVIEGVRSTGPPAGGAGARAPASAPESPVGGQRWVVKLDFLGANPSAQPVGRDPTPAVVSYFKGPKEDWKTALPTYGSLVYENLWPGIDLVYTGADGRLKATYVVKPGADPGSIRLAYRGPEAVAVTGQGRLRVSTPRGGFEEEKPYTYQESGGTQVEVASRFALQAAPQEGAFVYGFHVGGYDRIQTHGIHTIALGPKMIPPVRLLLQIPKLVKQLHRGLPLQSPQQIRYRHLRRDHHQQMHMIGIGLYVQLHHFAARIPADRLDPSFGCFLYRSGQYPEPILWHPHNMILTMPQRM
jgi:hypothetical protein